MLLNGPILWYYFKLKHTKLPCVFSDSEMRPENLHFLFFSKRLEVLGLIMIMCLLKMVGFLNSKLLVGLASRKITMGCQITCPCQLICKSWTWNYRTLKDFHKQNQISISFIQAKVREGSLGSHRKTLILHWFLCDTLHPCPSYRAVAQ